jgi:heme oxygenase (biliverdin-producing, ferredoxin)
MNNLKELTKENHTNAERQEFVKILFSGTINSDLYATFLYNQFPMYELLEVCAMPHGILNDIPEICRHKNIRKDFEELWGEREEKPQMCPVVQKYIAYIMSIRDDPKKLMAHIYVRHMGDLAGGQMIAKRVPGKGLFYQFDGDQEELKNKIRAKLDDSMADEAKVCFEFATQFFKEMMDFVEWKETESGTH